MNALKVGRFTVAVVPVSALELLEKNSRYMRHEMFRRLVENIKSDGQLSQFPFCLKVGEQYRVLSGNHRAKAAQAAGLEEIPIIFTDEPLSRQQQVAIQLSHNAIAGEDDATILKELWNELTEVSTKLYAGLDDKLLGLLNTIQLPPLSDVRLDFRTLSFLFLPDEVDRVKEAFTAGLEAAKGTEVYVARLETFDALLDALAKTGAAYNVKNGATALLVFLALYRRHLTALEEGWYDAEADAAKHKGWVPIASLFGSETLPADAAVVVRRAIEQLIEAGDVDPKQRWRALEWLAAEYVSGAQATPA